MYAYTGPSRLPLGHFWTLAVEEQFYFAWPLLVFTLRTRSRLLLVCLIFTIACPLARAALWFRGWAYFPVLVNAFLRADSLLAGGALALLLRGPAHDRVLRLAPVLTGAGAFIISLSLAAPLLHSQAYAGLRALGMSLHYTGFALFYSGLLAWVLRPSLPQRIFLVRPLRSLGRYSYGLYVWHLILFGYIQKPLRALLAHLTSSKGIGLCLTGFLAFIVSLLVAMLSYHLYEERFLRLKRFISYKEPRQREAMRLKEAETPAKAA